jgi:hypothetical protein
VTGFCSILIVRNAYTRQATINPVTDHENAVCPCFAFYVLTIRRSNTALPARVISS